MSGSRYETVLIFCEQTEDGKLIPIHIFIEDGSPLAVLRESHLKDVRDILVRLKESGWQLMSIWRVGKAPSGALNNSIAYLWYKVLLKLKT